MTPMRKIPYSKNRITNLLLPDSQDALPVIAEIGAPGFHDLPGNLALGKAISESYNAAVLIPSYELGQAAEAFLDLNEFIRTTADEYHFDLSKVVVLGVSSGAAFGALWAFGDGSPIRVRGYVGAGGLYGALVTPFIGGNRSLRIRLVHGEQDEAAPIRAARRLHEQLVAAGYDCLLRVGAGTHAETYLPGHPLGQMTLAAVEELAH
jgi:predicted esterase